MDALATAIGQRYPQTTVRAHYDPEVDIALFIFESGDAVSERRDWGLVDRSPEDQHVMGIELWEASAHLPAELLTALRDT
jgi:uncharacterized protein YuzE